MSRSRAVLPLIAVAATALALSACGSNTPTAGGATAEAGSTGSAKGPKGSLTIGLLNPTTGPFTALGEDVNAGFELYLKSKGGVLGGYGIKLLKEDETNDPAVATTKARQLVQKKAGIVVGLVNSADAYAVAPYLKEAGVPLLVTVAGADGLTRAKDGNLFRISYTSSQDTMPAGDYVCKTMGLKTASIVALDYAFGWEAAGGFARSYEAAGCKIVQELYAPLGTQDYSPYVTQIKKNAQVVFSVTPGGDSIRFFKAVQGFGLKTPVFAHGSSTDETLLPSLGNTADGVTSSLHYSAAIDTPQNKAFTSAWSEAKDRSANQYAEDGWTAAKILESALTGITGAATSAAITAAIPKVSIEAPRGPISFDDYGQAIYNVYFREVTKKGASTENSVIGTAKNVNQFYSYSPAEYLKFPAYEKLKGTWAK